MKKLKDILDFFISLDAFWKILLSILIFIVPLALVGLNNLGWINQTTSFSLPWAVVIILGTLAFYPLAKVVESGTKQRKLPLVSLYGMKWRRPYLSFRYPNPVCPIAGCETEVICMATPPPSYVHITSSDDLSKIRYEYQYTYECPIHGVLVGVPDESVELLQHKAKLALKRK